MAIPESIPHPLLVAVIPRPSPSKENRTLTTLCPVLFRYASLPPYTLLHGTYEGEVTGGEENALHGDGQAVRQHRQRQRESHAERRGGHKMGCGRGEREWDID